MPLICHLYLTNSVAQRDFTVGILSVRLSAGLSDTYMRQHERTSTIIIPSFRMGGQSHSFLTPTNSTVEMCVYACMLRYNE